jgi:lipopolysaccharide export system permease protein
VRLRLSRIEQYVLARTLMGVGGAFAVFATVIALIDFVELSRTVGGRNEVGFDSVLMLTVLNAPSLILILLPFSFLFGVVSAFVSLNRRSELIAMRAAGVSAWRFIFPAAGAALAIGVVTVTVLNPLASMMNAEFESLRAGLMTQGQTAAPQTIWLRQGDAHNQIVIRAHERVPGAGALTLRGVTLFVSTRAKDGSVRFSRRIEAAQAQLMPGYWLLSRAQEATPGAPAYHFDTLTLPSTLNGDSALERFASPKAVPFWGLWNAIARTEQAGFSATGYRLELQGLLATPLMFAAMSVLAAAFSLRLIRLGGLAALAGSGVGLGFVIFFFNEFCRALGKAGAVPPFVAAWTPPLIALLAGFTLLCYTEDG